MSTGNRAPKPRTVLLVDDDERVRGALTIILHWFGAWVVVGEAGDGLRAIELASMLAPALILVDLSFPDSLSVLAGLRAAAPSAMIVVLTADETPEMRDGALALGVAGYLLKSTPPDELIGQLRALLEAEGSGGL